MAYKTYSRVTNDAGQVLGIPGSAFETRDFLHSIACGDYSDMCMWKKDAIRTFATAVSGDLWAVAANYVFPDIAGMQLEVLSSAANDTMAGTGIQEIEFTYLDGDGLSQIEIIELDGVTPVSTIADDIISVQSFRAKEVGSGGVAAGNIDIRMIGGEATIYSQIPIGGLRARNSAFMVPSGANLIITDMLLSVGGTAASREKLATIALMTDYDDVIDTHRDFMMPAFEITLRDETVAIGNQMPIVLPAMTRITVRGSSATTDTIVTSALRGYLRRS